MFKQKITNEQQTFIKNNFWQLGEKPKKIENPQEYTVRPFLHRSGDLYWEKAYLEFKNQQTKSDQAALAADRFMTAVYTGGNLFEAMAPVSQQLSKAVPVVGIVWNLIDVVGAAVLAVRDHIKHDGWASKINLTSAFQLLLGTVVFTLLTYGPEWGINFLNHAMSGIMNAAGIAAIAAAACAFTFAAAMAFSGALEHREVKLHQARIKYLEKQKQNPKIGEGDKEELQAFLTHQEEQLVMHQRARIAWGLCTVLMTTVATTSVVLIAMVGEMSFWGIALPAIAAGLAFLFSALYRQKPDVEAAIKYVGSVNMPNSASFQACGQSIAHAVSSVFNRSQGIFSASDGPKFF